MSATLLSSQGRWRFVRYETPYPPLYEVWDGDDLVFTSRWRSSALRKFKQLSASP